jgi:hypothetical protein
MANPGPHDLQEVGMGPRIRSHRVRVDLVPVGVAARFNVTAEAR